MANLSSLYALFGDTQPKLIKGLDPTSSSKLFATGRGQDITLSASSGIDERGGAVTLSGGRGGSVGTSAWGAIGGGVSLFGGDSTIAPAGNVSIYGGYSPTTTGSVTLSSYWDANNPNAPATILLGSFSGTTGSEVSITSGQSADGDVSGGISIMTHMGNGASSQSGEIIIQSGSADGVSGQVTLKSGQGNGTGTINISTGLTDGTNPSGNIDILTGDGHNTGAISISTGVSATNNSGGVSLATGTGQETGTVSITTGYGDSISGDVYIKSGNSTVTSGTLLLATGTGEETGGISITTGIGDLLSGYVSIKSGNSPATSGDVRFNTGTGESTGLLVFNTGTATGGASGSVFLSSGSSDTQSGNLYLFTNPAPISGDVTIQTASSANAGDIYLIAGQGTDHSSSGRVDITSKSIIWGTNSPSSNNVLLSASDGGLLVTAADYLTLYPTTELNLNAVTSLNLEAPEFNFAPSNPALTTVINTQSLSNINLSNVDMDIDLETGFYLGVTADQTILNTDSATIRPRTANQAVQLTIGDGVYPGLALNAVSAGSLASTSAGDVSITSTAGEVSLIAPQGVNLVSSLNEVDIYGATLNITASHPTNPAHINLSSTDIPTSGGSAVDNRLLQVDASGILSALGFKFEIVEVGSATTTATGLTSDLYFDISTLYNSGTDRIFYNLEILKDIPIDYMFYFRDYATNPSSSSPSIRLRGAADFGGVNVPVRLNYLIYRI